MERKMRIIPAIDIIDGKCVRLTKGEYSTKKIYNENPLKVAREFEDNGIQYLHLVDLDGAKNKKITNYKVLERLAAKTGLKIDFGGGMGSDDDLRIAFECGARQITAGSVAINNTELFEKWLLTYGGERIILGADFKESKIVTHGWTKRSEKELIPHIEENVGKGILYTICTDVSKDGMLGGTSTEIYKEILETVKVNLIASGGISSLNDIEEILEAGCEGVIIGKAIYEGKISLEALKKMILSGAVS
jgi:phosphoribosylformimino-5-aminoimidazole carboxamide ribotide isomerase